MALTNTERQRLYREKKKEEGKKQQSFLLSEKLLSEINKHRNKEDLSAFTERILWKGLKNKSVTSNISPELFREYQKFARRKGFDVSELIENLLKAALLAVELKHEKTGEEPLYLDLDKL